MAIAEKINVTKEKSQAEVQLELIEEDNKQSRPMHSILISEGLKLEETQLVHNIDISRCMVLISSGRMMLATFARKLGKKPTVSQRTELALKRFRLQKDIESYTSRALDIWPLINDKMVVIQRETDNTGDLISDDSEDEDEWLPPLTNARTVPEGAVVILPSVFGHEACAKLGYDFHTSVERKIRIAQANDALHGLRLALTKKALQFRQLREGTSKTRRNRSWDQINTIASTARHLVRMYGRARAAILQLNPTPGEVGRYKALEREDLKITTGVANHQGRGTRNKPLAWFWTMDVSRDMKAGDSVKECKSPLLICCEEIIQKPYFSLSHTLVESQGSS